MKAAAIILLIVSLSLFAGCNTKITNTIITNMSDNITNIEDNTLIEDNTAPIIPEVNETIVIVNETSINDTIVVNSTNTTVMANPVFQYTKESKYLIYRDTGMIDDSINDIKSLLE